MTYLPGDPKLLVVIVVIVAFNMVLLLTLLAVVVHVSIWAARRFNGLQLALLTANAKTQIQDRRREDANQSLSRIETKLDKAPDQVADAASVVVEKVIQAVTDSKVTSPTERRQ